MIDLSRFLDDKQRITVWPSRMEAKKAVIQYIADKFEAGRMYSEKEVNAIIDCWHTFNDYFLIRRSLIDYKYMSRTRNGSCYWKEEQDRDN
jgi:hypothetical protein